MVLTQEEPTSFADSSYESELTGQSDLLPVTLFCKVIGAESVSGYSMIGDTSDFPMEIKDIRDDHLSNLVIVPGRKGFFFDKIFWGIAQKMVVPVALFASIGHDEASSSLNNAKATTATTGSGGLPSKSIYFIMLLIRS